MTLACILSFSLRAVSKTSAFGVLWLSSQSCCLRLKAHQGAETCPAIGQDHFPRTAPLLCLTTLTAPSLPHSHCHEERIFLFFYHPAVSHMAFTTLWCIGTPPGPFLQTLHPHNVSTVQLLCCQVLPWVGDVLIIWDNLGNIYYWTRVFNIRWIIAEVTKA